VNAALTTGGGAFTVDRIGLPQYATISTQVATDDQHPAGNGRALARHSTRALEASTLASTVPVGVGPEGGDWRADRGRSHLENDGMACHGLLQAAQSEQRGGDHQDVRSPRSPVWTFLNVGSFTELG